VPGMNSGLGPSDPTLVAAFRSALLHQGVADNGGPVAAGVSDSLVVGVRPSQNLAFSPRLAGVTAVSFGPDKTRWRRAAATQLITMPIQYGPSG